jgi:DNA-binding CsgD family transcriptional regulator
VASAPAHRKGEDTCDLACPAGQPKDFAAASCAGSSAKQFKGGALVSSQASALNPTERYIKALRERIAILEDELYKRRFTTFGPSVSDELWAGLNEKQKRIVGLIVKGHRLGYIGSELGHSEQTIKNMLRPIYKKFGAANRGELAARVLARNVGLERD